MGYTVTLPTRAAWTLTVADAMTEDEVITIGLQTYTLRDAVTTTANQVLVGANQTATAVNLLAAITLGDTAGTNYGSATVINPYVTAAIATAAQVICTARDAGLVGNGIVFTETGDGSWAQTTTAVGDMESFLVNVMAQSQVNSDVLNSLRAVTATAD